MIECVYDQDEVRFSLPVWIVVDAVEFERVGLPGGAELVDSPLHGPLIAFFTDEKLARRFIEERGLPGKRTFLIPEPDHLRFLLEIYDEMGMEYASIDCPVSAKPRNGTDRFPTVRQILHALAASEPA
jgi:hypothetical protein